MLSARERLDAIKARNIFNCIPKEDIGKFTGLELLNRITQGIYDPPSISGALDYILDELSEGRACFRGWPGRGHMNPLGTVHGGWAATIMDSALACAAHTTCAKGEACTTIEMKINLVRPIIPDMGELVCEGEVVHRGRTIAVSNATLKTLDGKLLATGSETCSIFKVS